MLILEVKFFCVNGNYYVRVRYDGNIVDTTPLPNIWEHTAPYIKRVMTWGYTREEIGFIVDPTCGLDAMDSIMGAIRRYADDEV